MRKSTKYEIPGTMKFDDAEYDFRKMASDDG